MIEQFTRCVITPGANCSLQEIEDLIKREEITNLANQKFCRGEISLNDYLDLLEVAGVNIDNYLSLIDNNFLQAGF